MSATESDFSTFVGVDGVSGTWYWKGFWERTSDVGGQQATTLHTCLHACDSREEAHREAQEWVECMKARVADLEGAS